MNLPPILRSTTSNELLNGSFDVVLLKIGGRFKFFYTQNRLGCVFIWRNVICMSIFLQIDTIIQKLQRYLHKVRHRNTPFPSYNSEGLACSLFIAHPVNICFIKCGAQSWVPFKRVRNSCTSMEGYHLRTASLELLTCVTLSCGNPSLNIGT